MCCLKGFLRSVSFPAQVLLLWAALHKTACFHLGNAAFPVSLSLCVLRKGVEMTPIPWRQETWRLAKLPEVGFACTRHYRHSVCYARKPSWTPELLQLTSTRAPGPREGDITHHRCRSLASPMGFLFFFFSTHELTNSSLIPLPLRNQVPCPLACICPSIKTRK